MRRITAALGVALLLVPGAADHSAAIPGDQLEAEIAVLAADRIATLEEARRALAALVARAEESDIWLFLHEDGTVTYIEIQTFYLLAINWEDFDAIINSAAVAAGLAPLIEANEQATIKATIALRQRIADIGAEIARMQTDKPPAGFAPDEVIVIIEDVAAPEVTPSAAPAPDAALVTYSNCAAAVADLTERQITIGQDQVPYDNAHYIGFQEACEGQDRGVEDLYIYPLAGYRGEFCGQFSGAIGNAANDSWMEGVAEWFANRAEACAAGQTVYCYGAMLVMRTEQRPPPNIPCN